MYFIRRLPGNGPAQPHLGPVKLVGSAEVVDDLGHWLSSFGAPLIVRELEVFDDRAALLVRFVDRRYMLTRMACYRFSVKA